ncbi:phage tail tube protein [Ancylobacter oerskovii]|uniref:Phage tail tube protein n=1 Tax=Ancylobacter oerskovii TaxID=459519 RepID=A0ABW4Z3T9_9HYPH|nr:phage tail tube protein [Ancylobacter oerskovii]MBS7546246.1 phage tail tube protein [Ancylobacter oerskovii]
MGKRIAGVSYMRVGSRQYPIKELEYDVTSSTREGVAGLDGVHGYKETPKVPYVSGQISTTPDVSIENLHAVTDETVTVEGPDGRVIVIRNAWYASDATAQPADGQVAFRFEGLSGDELMPNA